MSPTSHPVTDPNPPVGHCPAMAMGSGALECGGGEAGRAPGSRGEREGTPATHHPLGEFWGPCQVWLLVVGGFREGCGGLHPPRDHSGPPLPLRMGEWGYMG